MNAHTHDTPKRSHFSRRQFLKLTAVAGSLVGLGALGVDALQRHGAVRRVQTTRLLLGTVANLTLITDRPDDAEAAIEAAYYRMAELEQVMSRFKPHSQLTQLNTDGVLDSPHPALVEVLVRATRYSQLTGGAFDVTVEPVLALYRSHADRGLVPAPEAITDAQGLVDYRAVESSVDRIRLARSGMAITLDGIAKGYIIDQGADEFRRRGYANVLVELGGDMQAGGQAGDRPWQIGLQPPRESLAAQQMLVAQLDECALATSGDYMHAFTPDFRLHHILNPGTGASPHELSSASVVAPTACDADALATAVMVLGAERGLTLLAGLLDVEGVLVRKDGSQVQTAAFPRV